MLAIPHPQMDLFLKTPLGEERYQQQYPVKSTLVKGITVGIGSDFPSSLVPDPESFFYMQGWVTRAVPDHPELGTMNKSNAITVEQAIRGFTLGGAEALGNKYDQAFGSIEEGKSADMIVLNNNLIKIPTEAIAKTMVNQTIFRGNVVFNREESISELEVVDFEILNKELENAIDSADLNLLVSDELWGGGGCRCFAVDSEIKPGARLATQEVNEAVTTLLSKGYLFARPARTVLWIDNLNYWIQWTIKDHTKVLWAYDPELNEVVKILQIKDN